METSALFQKGTRDPLLTTVGAPYGYLVIEGYQPVEVLHLAGGKGVLKEAVDAEILTGDQAGELEQQMVAAGLPADEAALYQAVATFQVPNDYQPEHTFKVCKCTDLPPELLHGYIVDDEGDRIVQIPSLAEGFASCRKAAKGDKVHVLDAVAVFQQMVAANLPVNDEAYKVRIDALPEETRRKIVDDEDRTGWARIIEIPGLGRITVIEVPLPRDLFDGLFGAGNSVDAGSDAGKDRRRPN